MPTLNFLRTHLKTLTELEQEYFVCILTHKWEKSVYARLKMLTTPSSVSVEGIRFWFADTHNSLFGEAEERRDYCTVADQISIPQHFPSDSRIKLNSNTLVNKDEPEMPNPCEMNAEPPPCFEHTHHTHTICSWFYIVCVDFDLSALH